MENLIKTIETVVMISLPIFAITMLIIISSVRKKNKELIESSIKNKWILNFDLSVFSKSRQEFAKLNHSKVILKLNFLTGLLSILGFLFIFILGIIEEVIKL